MKKRGFFTILLCLCCLIILVVFVGRIFANGEYGEPEVRVSLVKFEPATQTILMQFTVTNIGERLLVIPGLREEDFQRCKIWNGWIIFIRNEQRDGYFAFSRYLHGRCSLFSPLDNIHLKPGEQYRTTVNIADAIWMSPYNEDDGKPSQRLIDTPGKYRISFNLAVLSDNIPALFRWGVWRGVVDEDVIYFSLPSNRQAF